jgi:serine/threonine protein kinase
MSSSRRRKHTDDSSSRRHSNKKKRRSKPSTPGGVFGRCASIARFGTLDCIGKGTYGTVYRAIDQEENQVYALKRVILHNEKSDGFPTTSVREIRILKSISHRNIVKLHDVIVGEGRDDVFLTFEYCEHDMSTLLQSFRSSGTSRISLSSSSSSFSSISKRGGSSSSSTTTYNCKFGEGGVKRLMLGLLSGLHHLHERLIIHRDLKMSNLLYNSRGVIKIADFGMSRFIPQPAAHARLSPKVMTLWYRAPEMMLGTTTYDMSVDVWSLGCIFAELWTGKPLFRGSTDLQQLSLIFGCLGAPTVELWPSLMEMPNAKNITFQPLVPIKNESLTNILSPTSMSQNGNGFRMIRSLLAYDPARRPSAETLLLDPYFEESPRPLSESMMPTFKSTHSVKRDEPRKAKQRKR